MFGSESQLYLTFAKKSLRISTVAYPLISLSVITTIFFQAIGKPTQAMFLSMTRQVAVLLPAIILFAYLMGVEGALWSTSASDTVPAVVALSLLFKYRKKYLMERKNINYNRTTVWKQRHWDGWEFDEYIVLTEGCPC